MQTNVRFILTLACLLTTSCSSSSNAPLPTVAATETPTLIPSPTKTPTPSNTPTPTETFTPTPTETPGPYWQTPFGEFPHAVNDSGMETFNFLAPFEEWPKLPDITPSSIKAYHDALKQIKLSDGSLLVKPMNTEEFTSLPPLNWVLQDWTGKNILYIGTSNYGDRTNPPARYVGGFRFYYLGSDTNEYTRVSIELIGVTMQVLDPSSPEGYSLWTAIFPWNDISSWNKNRLTAMLNNSSQLSPFLNFTLVDNNDQHWRMFKIAETEGWIDPTQYNNAFVDFINNRQNTWFDSHVMLAQTPATRWRDPNP